jgi:SH3 domain protein
MKLLPLPTKRLTAGTLACIALVLSQGVVALEFNSAGATGAILYAHPDSSSKKLGLISPRYPVEVLQQQRDWSQIRDATGMMAWISTPQLGGGRSLLVMNPRAPLKTSADENSTTLAELAQNTLLDWQEPPRSGWVRVKHGKQTGFVRLADVWGL